MRVILLAETGSLKGQTIQLDETQEITFGRGERATYQVDTDGVSRLHCKVHFGRLRATVRGNNCIRGMIQFLSFQQNNFLRGCYRTLSVCGEYFI